MAERLFGAAADIPGVREMLGRYQRLSASPTMAALLWKSVFDLDVRAVLPAVRAPTLVLSRRDDRMIPFGAAKALAADIPGADFQEMPPGPHALFDEALGSAILEFVCDKPVPAATERVLSTVLFTDIVFGAHVEVELGIDPHELTNPWQAAASSAVSFTLGALLPLLAILLPPAPARIPVTVVAVLVALSITGWIAARLGGGDPRLAALRVTVGGALAMAITFAIGHLVGGTVT